MLHVAQPAVATAMTDWQARAHGAMLELLQRTPQPGRRIALLVGSRGIANLSAIVHGAVEALRSHGHEAVLLPAMGSHGGGQRHSREALLRELGIDSEDLVGAPFIGSDEMVPVASADGTTLYWDAAAATVDGLVAINRIKPHPTFQGPLESGICKMFAVGLGGPRAAAVFHARSDLPRGLVDLARLALGTGRVIGGIAVLERGTQTVAVEALPAEGMIDAEMRLLEIARTLVPRLPLAQLDLLIVDRIGKDVSGTAMDAHVTGRRGLEGESWPGPIRRIYARRLSGDGNANGVGMADAVHRDLATAIDWQKTLLNVLTTTFVRRAQLPPVFDCDLHALAFLWRTLGEPAAAAFRLAWIASTLELSPLWISEACQGDLPSNWQLRSRGRIGFAGGALRVEGDAGHPG